MSAHTENGICFLSRLRQKEDAIDSEMMNNSYVFVINTNETDLIDANAFIHYICKNVVNKYSGLKSDISPELENTPEEDIENKDFKESQRSLDSLRLSDNSDDSDQLTSNPMIIVFDGCEAFNLWQFSNLISNVSQLKHLAILKASDATQLLSAISNELSLNLALNPDLKLVIIYALPSNMCPKIVEKIHRLLSSLVISVRIILVVDRITKTQINEFTNKSMFEILSIKYLNSNQIHIKTSRKSKTFVRDIS